MWSLAFRQWGIRQGESIRYILVRQQQTPLGDARSDILRFHNNLASPTDIPVRIGSKGPIKSIYGLFYFGTVSKIFMYLNSNE